MSDFQAASLKEGLQATGWLASQSLLVWGTDKKGKKKNLIIDGEHRWTVASALGFKKAPMVVLDGIDEAKARELTLKLNHNRGTSDEGKLRDVLLYLQEHGDQETLALRIGIEEERVMVLLAEEPNVIAPGADVALDGDNPIGSIEMPSGKQTHVKMVQLFFDQKTHAEFEELVQERAKHHPKEKNITDVVLGAMRAARSTS